MYKTNQQAPNLIRTSRFSSEFIRKHLDFINTPLKLDVHPNANIAICDWSPQEVASGRRIVQLLVAGRSPTHFQIDVRIVPPNSIPTSDKHPLISCVRWHEKDSYVVTSVDILLVLESLVGEPFSNEEKSRVRRNLQFLKPATVTRGDGGRLFNSLMSMENPRPRNIEKDLKVFKWTDLFVAINRVLSKYSANPHSFVNTSNANEYAGASKVCYLEHPLTMHRYPLSDPTISSIEGSGACWRPSPKYIKYTPQLPNSSPRLSQPLPGGYPKLRSSNYWESNQPSCRNARQSMERNSSTPQPQVC